MDSRDETFPFVQLSSQAVDLCRSACHYDNRHDVVNLGPINVTPTAAAGRPSSVLCLQIWDAELGKGDVRKKRSATVKMIIFAFLLYDVNIIRAY